MLSCIVVIAVKIKCPTYAKGSPSDQTHGALWQSLATVHTQSATPIITASIIHSYL